MAFIRSNIVKPTTTRRRDGEDLSDPITEFEDGDGESIDVEHLFQHLVPYRDFSLETGIEGVTEGELGLEEIAVAVPAGAGLAGAAAHAGREGSDQPTDQQESEERRIADELRVALGEGLRAFLRTLHAESRNRPLRLRLGHAVAQARILARIHVEEERIRLRLELTEARALERGSPVSVRTRSAAPVLELRALGRLHPDGSVSGIGIALREQAVDSLRAALDRPLERIEGLRVAGAGRALGALAARAPAALVAFSARTIDRLRLAAPVADAVLPFASVRVALSWAHDRAPRLRTETDPPRDLGEDLAVIRRLIDVIRSIPSAEGFGS